MDGSDASFLWLTAACRLHDLRFTSRCIDPPPLHVSQIDQKFLKNQKFALKGTMKANSLRLKAARDARIAAKKKEAAAAAEAASSTAAVASSPAPADASSPAPADASSSAPTDASS